MTGLVDVRGRPLRASAHGPERVHEAARRSGAFMANWRAGGLRSSDADWLPDRDDVIARSRDVARNEGVGASAGMRVVNSAVGFRWDLTPKPNWRALGISYEAARELGAQIGAQWEQYAYGIHFCPDAERTKTFGQLLRLSAAHIFHDGEALGLIEWADDEATQFQTRLRLVDPDRLSNPNGRPDGPTLRGGVEKSFAGVPQRYWIREGHPTDLGGVANMTWRPWERYSTTLGRPQVLHAFDQLRAGQSRGITRFVTVLKLFRSLSKYTEKTIEAAALNALFLGFVKSNAGPSAVKEGFEAEDVSAFAAERSDHYDENPVEVDGVRFPVLGLDDEVQMQTTARDTSGFDGFTRSILRLIAAALGVTYEELSMDFSQTNYSSARAALLVAWKETLALRGLIEQQIAWPFFAAWLEEAFDIGVITAPAGAPDFYDAIDAYVDGRWRGPGRGHIDPTKEVLAAAARIEAGISTLEDECAEYDGSDWEEKLEQQARENARRRDLGLPEARTAGSVPADDPEEDRRRDERPSALSQLSTLAAGPAHEAFLDARPVA
jgi:lambda family phage portal protein